MNNFSATGELLPIILPLLSAVGYVVAALLLKRAGELGAGPWRLAWTCNWISAIVFSPLALLGGSIPSWNQLWQPAFVASLYLFGQVLTFYSFKIGDVSVATPVLGLKIILVAFFTTVLLREKIS